MNTATQTLHTITAAKSHIEDEFVLDLVRWATESAMHASPERIAEMMKQAYGDHGPDSAKRWREQRAAREQMQRRQASPAEFKAVNGPAKPGRSRRRSRPVRGQVNATCAYEACGQPFERRARHQRFCSLRCRRGAARLRDMATVRPQGDPEAIVAEMEAALAHLGALVAQQEAGR